MTVTDADTALAWRSGSVPVLASPRVIALCEEASIAALAGALGEGETSVGMRVQKCGKTTGVTVGVVDLIDYDFGHHGSHSDLWIDGDGADFSQKGDSGALYLESSHPEPTATWLRVVGLHWGGAEGDGVGHPIRAVFEDLRLAPLDSTARS